MSFGSVVIRDPRETVTVRDDRVTVVAVASQGPQGPTAVAPGAVIAAPGDLIVGDALGDPDTLPVGPDGAVLVVKDGLPAWGTPFFYASTAAALTAAITLAEAAGGTVVAAPGTYAGPFTIDANAPVRLIGYGATITVAASVVGLTIAQGSGGNTLGAVVEGFRIDGNSAANTTGVLVHNSDRATLRNLRIEDCTRGIHLLSTDLEWVEECACYDTLITQCDTGILFETTGTGTGSFGETKLGNVGVNGCDIGIDLAVDGVLYRSSFDAVAFWVGDNQTAFVVDGNVAGSWFDLGIESSDLTPTAIYGVDIQANASNVEVANWRIDWSGSFTDRIVLAGGKVLEYQRGTERHFVDGDGRGLRVYRDGDADANYRFAVATEFAGGGGLLFGSGAAVPDVYLYRNGADNLTTDTGDTFQVGSGAWNAGHLRLGNYHLWVDATGDLRIKNGGPASDLDGTVVGTQS